MDRRRGRKGKRQKSSTKLINEKDQAMSSGKENVDGRLKEQVKFQDSLHCDGINNLGDNGAKTLRQLQAEEDDEERFQADLKKAIRQSLGLLLWAHYHCFAYSHDHERWIMYDDKTVKAIGAWDDVLSTCERGHL